jgi:hypothetical protein
MTIKKQPGLIPQLILFVKLLYIKYNSEYTEYKRIKFYVCKLMCYPEMFGSI